MRMTPAQQFDRLAYVQDWDQDLQCRLMRKFLMEPVLNDFEALRAQVFTAEREAEFMAIAQTAAENLILTVLRDDPDLELQAATLFGFDSLDTWHQHRETSSP